MNIKHLVIIVHGKVQGVHFRAATKAVANLLGVKGMVKNQADGTVYMEAEGSEIDLDNFIDWCQEGPDDAVVEKVDIHAGELKNYRNFEIVKK